MNHAEDFETRGANPQFANMVPSLTGWKNISLARIAARQRAGLAPDPKDLASVRSADNLIAINIEHRKSRGLPYGLETRDRPSLNSPVPRNVMRTLAQPPTPATPPKPQWKLDNERRQEQLRRLEMAV